MICKITYIYALVDPESGAVRYVGKADCPHRRLQRHACDAEDNWKARWIRALRRLGRRPALRVLEVVPFYRWQERERYWIAHFKALGAELTNSSEGGIGPLMPAPETRMKMRAAKLGRTHSAEHRAKVSAALKGRAKPRRTAEHIAALTAACLGKEISPAHRVKLAAANMLRAPTSAAGYKGVYFDQARGKYQALITVNQRIIHLGRHSTALDAALAYNAAALENGWPAEGLNQIPRAEIEVDLMFPGQQRDLLEAAA